ncbi:phage/plasmid primase, P4 family [Staphylococcus epidermidis]|uniref:phage/plasmid primase, P4 family n=1 Tax=Staphylococcus epidermidis TaxID=1282 RepID=UPI00138B167B|nr:DUF5906 domain-containing protein [Staphylococcus epidermidis]
MKLNPDKDVLKEIKETTINYENENIEQKLNRLGIEERERMIKSWESDNKRGKKPNVISTNRCANILIENMNFLLFDEEENTKLAMYQEDRGVYTQKTSLIKRIISYLEPKHNSNKADDVIYHIRNRTEIKEKTNSPYLIPVNNGVFNRKTKQLENFSPNYVFTSKIDTNYIDNPNKPTFDDWDINKWFDELACNDKQVSHLLWQVINDSLNGNYTRKQSIFMVGDGNNGKGTFQELLTNLIGKRNIATLKVNEFDHRFKMSLLEGKTAVIGDDVPVGVYIDDGSNFKSVVTGDYVSVEFKNQQSYTAQYRCSVIQSSNGMPRFKDKTNAVFKRLVIVPFNADFKGDKEKRKIKDEYIKNKQVLEYILYHAIRMDFEKFSIPDVSKKYLDVYKQENNPVYEFKINVFDEWKLRKVPKYIVYGLYKEFCKDNGYNFLSKIKFHKEFKTYLGDEWKSDTVDRFNWQDLIDGIGDLDVKKSEIEFPDEHKTYKAYENCSLKAV